MPRTSKAEVHAVFARLCRELGPASADLSLDHNAAYGGWAISQSDGARYPFGGFMSAGRLPAGEFVRAMRFAIAALELRAAGPAVYTVRRHQIEPRDTATAPSGGGAGAIRPVVIEPAPDRDAAIAALGTGCC